MDTLFLSNNCTSIFSNNNDIYIIYLRNRYRRGGQSILILHRRFKLISSISLSSQDTNLPY